ncbi:MAG: peptidylprolyl isomerase [Flavobacteriaceae bacterium]
MAILGKIRQRSIFLILVIGMALFAFVISGVFDGNSSNSGTNDPIAIINDEEVGVDFFRQMVDQTQRTYNYSTLKSVNLVWNQALKNTIFDQEFKKLGIDAGRDQLEQIISSDDQVINNPSFQNEAGFFDFGIFSDYISQMKIENPSAYDNWKVQENSIIGIAKQRIYLDLIKASNVMTESEAKANYHFENDNVNIDYVRIPFEFIPDSLIKVSDAEIKNYIKDNEADYKFDESRNIQYVTFNEIPTEDDIAAIRLRLEGLKAQIIAYNDVSKLTDTIEGFKETKTVADFIDQYSEVSFDSVYKPRGAYNNEYADILFGLNEGDVFGPYRDRNSFKISRLLDRKKNSSLRASHILVAYKGATRSPSGVTLTKNEAKRKANRILREAKRASTNFAELARENSDGPTKNRGGDLGFFKEGEMAVEFFNFVNNNRVGKVGLVETEFGFHVIRITDKDDLALIADVVAEALPSDKTSNEIFRKATQFEMDSAREKNEFNIIAERNGYSVRPVKQIKSLEENLPGLTQQRNIVRWAFEKDTKIGDIKRFSLSRGGYVVVQLTDKLKEGLASIEQVGEEVRQIIIREKKGTLIKNQYADKLTIQALAENDKLSIESASAVNQKNPTIVGAGNEPTILGVAFSLKPDEESQLIIGEKGVYKILLKKKNIVDDLEDYLSYAEKIRQDTSIQMMESVYAALESVAEIDDNRTLYY